MKKRFMSILLILCMVLTLLPTTAFAADELATTIINDWYYLRCMNNYLNLTANGDAELRKLSANEAFYVENKGAGKFTLKMKDGRYLGLEGTRKEGMRVKAVNSPYTWLVYSESTNFGREKTDIFSLRPPEVSSMVVNASGEKNADGTPIIIWKHEAIYGGFDAPNHAEFRFIPATTTIDATGETWTTFTENNLVGYKDRSGNVVIKPQFAEAKNFSQGIARVRQPDKDLLAYINTAGEPITPSKYYGAICDFVVRDGLMRVGTWGDDITRALMNGERFDYWRSEKGKATVVMKSGAVFNYSMKAGFIDTTGKEVIPLQFDEANSFKDGMAAVFKYQGMLGSIDYNKVGWIDKTGKLVIPYRSDDALYYDWNVHNFKDGLVCYFVETDKDPYTLPAAGIMDKTGKIIIPADKDERFYADSFGLLWRDGVIAASPVKEVNAKGIPTKGGGHEWSFSSLYDYSGKLIKKLDGYVHAIPIGGGYTLALHKLPKGALVDVLDTQMNSAYWSVFDRNGKIVVDHAEKNNFYLGDHIGYENGYVYFGGSRYEVAPATSGFLNPGSLLTAQESIRLSGSDRFETAAEISKNGWALSENLVLANSNSFSGALVGSSLAYLKDAPVLLTDTKSLSSVTAREIERLGAKTVYIIGNKDEVSLEIENELKDKYKVLRISGSDQFNTAVKIGEEVKKIKAFDTVALATQNDFPDALAITPFSAKNTMPILFSGKDKLRDDTRAALLAWGIKQVVIAGGTGVISLAVEDELKNMGLGVTRLAGEDRYDTALAIVKHFENAHYTKITLATGLNYPDALTGAALAAKKGLPLLLIKKDDVEESVKVYLDAHKLEQAYIFGGEGVIAKNIVGR